MKYLDITDNLGSGIDTSQPMFWKKRNETVLKLINHKPSDDEIYFARRLDRFNIPYFLELSFTDAWFINFIIGFAE